VAEQRVPALTRFQPETMLNAPMTDNSSDNIHKSGEWLPGDLVFLPSRTSRNFLAVCKTSGFVLINYLKNDFLNLDVAMGSDENC